jgi:hypothetical protein
MSFRQREQQKLIRLYQEETGIYDYKPIDVAEWLAARNYKMPEPPTAAELLAKELSRAARTENRPSEGSSVSYRANHAYLRLVNGQWEWYWFDLDGPAATKEKVERALRMRQKHVLDCNVGSAAIALHWNATRSPEEKIVLDFDFNDEVTWRLNAPDEDEDGQQKKAG